MLQNNYNDNFVRKFINSRLIRPSESSCKLEMISMPIYDKVIPNNENKIKRRKNDPGHASMRSFQYNFDDRSIKFI